MYLKSIEMQGFKSFAQKIVLEFKSGVTGIVGPNGSGKSNVADAVRWVLGEQSAKQLRSSNMQDVIFAGTQSRKPVSFASVVITFDNTDRTLAYDADEVVVARRVFRSGESEYQLGGSTCRLRDILELFYDTGIGKEGYSIIGQGQIDRILSTKPEERRELFDEAAGIVKYKKRKIVAERKLEKENESLVRVSDILGELGRQVGPLERQAEKAKEYLSLKEELKLFEVNQFLLSQERRAKALEEIAGNLKIASEDLAGVRMETEVLRRQHEQLDEERQELDEVLAQQRETLHTLSVRKEAAEGQIGVLRARIETEEMSRAHYESRRAAIAEEAEERNRAKAALNEEQTNLNRALEELEEESIDADSKVRAAEEKIASLEELIRTSRESMLSAIQGQADLRTQRQHYETLMEQSRLRQSELSGRILRRAAEEEALRGRIAELEEAIAGLDRDGAALYERLDGGRAEAEQIREALAAGEKEAEASLQEHHRIRARLESLVNLAERYEGYGGSVRAVMEEKGRLRGIVGVVADLVKTDQKYETAIETALGGALQNVVTETEADAKRAIAFLKEERRGRATFLPLDAARENRPFPRTEALKEEGVLGTADSLVRCDKNMTDIVRSLLGRTAVVRDMDRALAIARKYSYGFRMVTLEGELLQPGGSITGGAYKNNSNLLGRRREIAELTKRSEETEAALTAVRAAQEKREETLAALAAQEEEIRAALQEKQIEKNTRVMEKSQAEEQLEGLLSRDRDTDVENREITEQLARMREQEEELLRRTGELAGAQQAHEEASAQAESDLAAVREEREEVTRAQAEVRARLGGMYSRMDSLNENLDRIAQEEKKVEEELAVIGSGSESSQASGAALEEEIGRCRTQIETAEDSIAQLTALIARNEEKRQNRLAEQKEIFGRRDASMERQTTLEKEVYRLETQKEREEEAAERQAAYLFEEYQLTPSEARSLKKEDFTLSQVSARVSSLKNSIRALGNVNVNAIEEYRETSERYEFLKNQHDDLVKATDSLREVIHGLEEGMRKQFLEKFAEIQKEFNVVFGELFGGGQGSLELMDDGDVLTAGVSIIAQPPGKKLQNMMQLSGGEKALTAISLLFAIQRLKPSPFCLLDEIEAALDDVNVNRFAHYLNQLKEKIQFIVITHRRGTMTIADRLYGITMQEKGVSSLVSVDLTDAEE
ncbi:MAG: chromosome segregation protein SMC [Lachnospiraceae bacterium]|nr:chromosome segregation protein SMC [Lachnospiraceae bacterium]